MEADMSPGSGAKKEKMNMKKIIALLLCVVMICSCMGVTAFAEEQLLLLPVEEWKLEDSLYVENSAVENSKDKLSERITLTLTDGLLSAPVSLSLKSDLEGVDIFVEKVESVGKESDKIVTAPEAKLDGALITIPTDVPCSYDVHENSLLNTVVGEPRPYEYQFTVKLVRHFRGDNPNTQDVTEDSYEYRVEKEVEFSVSVFVYCTHANKGRIEKITDEASLFDEGSKAIYCEGCGWYLGDENIPIWMLQDNGRGLIWLIIQLFNLIASLFAPPEPTPV